MLISSPTNTDKQCKELTFSMVLVYVSLKASGSRKLFRV